MVNKISIRDEKHWQYNNGNERNTAQAKVHAKGDK